MAMRFMSPRSLLVLAAVFGGLVGQGGTSYALGVPSMYVTVSVLGANASGVGYGFKVCVSADVTGPDLFNSWHTEDVGVRWDAAGVPYEWNGGAGASGPAPSFQHWAGGCYEIDKSWYGPDKGAFAVTITYSGYGTDIPYVVTGGFEYYPGTSDVVWSDPPIPLP